MLKMILLAVSHTIYLWFLMDHIDNIDYRFPKTVLSIYRIIAWL